MARLRLCGDRGVGGGTDWASHTSDSVNMASEVCAGLLSIVSFIIPSVCQRASV